MRVFLIDFDTTLSPLTDRLPKILLPICGKSIAIYYLELLSNTEIKKVNIISPNIEKLQENLGDGSKFGIEIIYKKTLPDTNNEDLILSSDCLLDTDFKTTLTDAKKIKITSLTDFHQVNLDILTGKYQYLKPAGRLASERLYLNNMSQYKTDNLCSGFLYLGRQCRLQKSVVVQNHNVLGDNVIVSKEVKLTHAVILPDTYIGKFTEIKDAIVWGNVLIKPKNEVVVEITDDFVLADLAKNQSDNFFTKLFKK